VLLYDWRALDTAGRERVIALQKRYEQVWDDVIRRLQRSGDWASPTRIDRLLMFGALNWIVQWYRPRGPLSVAQLVDDAEKFLPAHAGNAACAIRHDASSGSVARLNDAPQQPFVVGPGAGSSATCSRAARVHV